MAVATLAKLANNADVYTGVVKIRNGAHVREEDAQHRGHGGGYGSGSGSGRQCVRRGEAGSVA
jgi:hypothetical protein